MEQVLQRLRNQPLSQQLALAAAGCCLLATLTLVGVAAQSTQSIRNMTRAEHADAAEREGQSDAQTVRRPVGPVRPRRDEATDAIVLSAVAARVRQSDGVERSKALATHHARLAARALGALPIGSAPV